MHAYAWVCTHTRVYGLYLYSVTTLKSWKRGKRDAENDKYKGGKFFHTIVTPPVPLEPAKVYVSLLTLVYSPFVIHNFDMTPAISPAWPAAMTLDMIVMTITDSKITRFNGHESIMLAECFLYIWRQVQTLRTLFWYHVLNVSMINNMLTTTVRCRSVRLAVTSSSRYSRNLHFAFAERKI